VWLLLTHNDNITSFHAWVLICLAMELVLIVVWCSFVNLDLNDLLFFAHLLSIASLTFVLFVNYFTFSTAIIARSLRLCVHSRSKLLHSDHHSSSLTSAAFLYCSIFASLAIALCTQALSVDSNFGILSTVDLFEGQLHWMHHWFSLLWASILLSSHSTSEAKEVRDVHSCVSPSILKSFFSMLVIDVPFLLVGKNFICLINLLELFFITTAIWMFFQSLFPESFSDLIIGRCLFYSE